MIRIISKYVLMFISLVLAQVLIFNQIQFSGFFNPYVYLLFIILLPLSSPRYLVLILAFLLGFIIDIFSNSLGVHSAATVFAAYARPLVIRIISNREDDKSDYPGLHQNKLAWFVNYVVIMVLLHHFVLFYLEVYTFANFLNTLYRVILSSLFSIIIIVLSQFLVFKDL
ncbi:MAG: rod shape-determining protein [Prolixibacteraceae bacterium]|nr:MAG: rod shape-determining protein [Prolixibacteraceae bacterium]